MYVNRAGGIQILEERAIFGMQIYVSSKDFSLYEMSQDWKEAVTVCCTHCAPQIIYILGKKNNLVVQTET